MILQRDDPLTKKWQSYYDSAFAQAGTVNQHDENCVKDGRLVSQGGPFEIVDVIPGDTRRLAQAGYKVEAGRLVKIGVSSSGSSPATLRQRKHTPAAAAAGAGPAAGTPTPIPNRDPDRDPDPDPNRDCYCCLFRGVWCWWCLARFLGGWLFWSVISAICFIIVFLLYFFVYLSA